MTLVATIWVSCLLAWWLTESLSVVLIRHSRLWRLAMVLSLSACWWLPKTAYGESTWCFIVAWACFVVSFVVTSRKEDVRRKRMDFISFARRGYQRGRKQGYKRGQKHVVLHHSDVPFRMDINNGIYEVRGSASFGGKGE